jgi:hypothetical protein
MKELLIIIIILYSLFNFVIDYLSNTLITHNELKIGIITFFHHLLSSSLILSPIILFTKINNGILLFLLIVIIIAQVSWIIYKDVCIITQYQNTLINEEYKNYKWICDIHGFIKKYIRGDDWAYSNIRNNSKIYNILVINGLLILYSLKKILV